MRSLVLAGAVMLLAAAAMGVESNVEQAAALSRRAIDLLDQRKLVEAEKALRDSLALVPGNPTRLYNLACVLAAQKKTADAMAVLEQATEAGFTDFTHMQSNPTLAAVRELPGYAAMIARKEQIVRHAAELGIDELKKDLGEGYLYQIDEPRKLLFAVAIDEPTLERLKDNLQLLAAAEWAEIFSHKPDEFVRVIVPSDADFRRMTIASSHIGGSYDDTTRTLVAQHLGRYMFHEFTHALHAGDQHALRQEHPVWLSEGLASLFEAVQLRDGKFVVADNSRLPFVKNAAKMNGLLRLDQLTKMGREDFNNRPNLAYGEASFLLRYLQEHGLLKKFYDTYTAGYGEDPTGASALEEAAGMKLPALLVSFTEWAAARPDLPTAERPDGPMLGLSLSEGVDGLRVSRVMTPGPSEALRIGDVVIALDQQETRDRQALDEALASYGPGASISVRIRRGKDYLEQAVVLGRRQGPRDARTPSPTPSPRSR